MIIKVVQFGEIEFEENDIYHFDNGIIGFEELKKFVLLNTEESLFYWLISVDEPEIVFPLIEISLLKDDYPMPADCIAWGIVSLNKEPEKITVNLKSPVYINPYTKNGFQDILENETLQINYQLFIKEKE